MARAQARAPIPSPESISVEEFQTQLARYPSCIEDISRAKGAKAGQQSLADLDRFRYGEALDLFGSRESRKQMDIADVKRLVEWKLRHGTFRPTLMSLVSSNQPDAVRSAVQDALQTYDDGTSGEGESKDNTSSSPLPALAILTKRLRGIGPATASLLLAVHDPARVVFFADEAFLWLCSGSGSGSGKKSSSSARLPAIKYTAAEYAALYGRARALAARLGVRAVDVERVAFVLLRGGVGSAGGGGGGGGDGKSEEGEKEEKVEGGSQGGDDDDDDDEGTGRSRAPAPAKAETDGKARNAAERTAEKPEKTQPGKKRKAAPAGADGGRPKQSAGNTAVEDPVEDPVDSVEASSAPPLRRSKRGKT